MATMISSIRSTHPFPRPSPIEIRIRPLGDRDPGTVRPATGRRGRRDGGWDGIELPRRIEHTQRPLESRRRANLPRMRRDRPRCRGPRRERSARDLPALQADRLGEVRGVREREEQPGQVSRPVRVVPAFGGPMNSTHTTTYIDGDTIYRTDANPGVTSGSPFATLAIYLNGGSTNISAGTPDDMRRLADAATLAADDLQRLLDKRAK